MPPKPGSFPAALIGTPAGHGGVSSTLRSCPLCLRPGAELFAQLHGRTYLRCPACDLTFLDPGDRPSPEAAHAHYATHQNDSGDVRYRAFLSRLADPLVERLAPGAHGLDYGSGPGPTLSVMLEERGFAVTLYDPLFAPDEAALQQTYDFITCTETAEHFFDVSGELARLDRLLRPGGWIGLMTELLEPERVFAEWRYARDPTHTSFYSRRTLDWIAERFGWSYLPLPQNVTLFRKPLQVPPGASSG